MGILDRGRRVVIRHCRVPVLLLIGIERARRRRRGGQPSDLGFGSGGIHGEPGAGVAHRRGSILVPAQEGLTLRHVVAAAWRRDAVAPPDAAIGKSDAGALLAVRGYLAAADVVGAGDGAVTDIDR